MKEAWIRQILSRYGENVSVTGADGTSVTAKAMIQPAAGRGESVPDRMSGIGWGDGRRWLYLGQLPVESGDSVEWNGMRFRVRSGREWFLKRRSNHWWAVLEQAKEAAQ